MCAGSPTAGTWSSSQWRPDNEFETDRSKSGPESPRMEADPVLPRSAVIDPHRAEICRPLVRQVRSLGRFAIGIRQFVGYFFFSPAFCLAQRAFCASEIAL